MRRPGPATHAAISLAIWPLTIIFSPVILLAGELTWSLAELMAFAASQEQ